MNLDMPSRMPSSSGREPPDSDVPAPRGTTLTFISCRQRHDRLHLLHSLGQNDDERQRAIHGERVAIISAPRRLIGDDACVGQDCSQLHKQFFASRQNCVLQAQAFAEPCAFVLLASLAKAERARPLVERGPTRKPLIVLSGQVFAIT